VNDLLSKEIDVLTVQQEINTQARADIDRSQRNISTPAVKAIQTELGEGNELYEEVEQYRNKIPKGKNARECRGRILTAVEKAGANAPGRRPRRRPCATGLI
jgi:ATP-dependent Lon protease